MSSDISSDLHVQDRLSLFSSFFWRGIFSDGEEPFELPGVDLQCRLISRGHGLVTLMERFPSGRRVAIHWEGFIPDGLDFIDLWIQFNLRGLVNLFFIWCKTFHCDSQRVSATAVKTHKTCQLRRSFTRHCCFVFILWGLTFFIVLRNIPLLFAENLSVLAVVWSMGKNKLRRNCRPRFLFIPLIFFAFTFIFVVTYKSNCSDDGRSSVTFQISPIWIDLRQ